MRKKLSKQDALSTVLTTAADAEDAMAVLNSYGYAIVPIEPTTAMIYEGGGCWYATTHNYKSQNENAAAVYKAMVAAASLEQ